LLRHYAGYIASGGDRDFMRPISQDVYGIPRQRVIGSATALGYTPEDRGGTITHKAEPNRRSTKPRILRAAMSSYRPVLMLREQAGGVRLHLGSLAHGDGPTLQEALDEIAAAGGDVRTRLFVA
jgi:hypothetical protein